MFVQYIEGKAADQAGVRRSMERWEQDLMPGATGYLGTTAGFTPDGTFVALARFDDEAAARANSERPEQGEWWAEMEKNFDGAVSFVDCAEARTVLDGGSDDAGFVQVMRGRSTDVPRLAEMFVSHADDIRARRPEIIGALLLDSGDGQWVHAIYFTDEESARQGEQQEMPPEMQAEFEEAMQLGGEPTFFDLREPILVSAPQ
jgi:hypothetical protein